MRERADGDVIDAGGGHLSGVGERIHIAPKAVTLETHIADVVNVIEAEELLDAILDRNLLARQVDLGAELGTLDDRAKGRDQAEEIDVDLRLRRFIFRTVAGLDLRFCRLSRFC